MTAILASVFSICQARSHDLERTVDHLIRGAPGTTPHVQGEGKEARENTSMKDKKVDFVLPELLCPLRMLKTWV